MRVIAIDGPAGAGKSTVAKALAERLGLDYLDTGAMYRGVAFAALRRRLDPADAEAIARLAEGLELTVVDSGVTVDGTDASIEIRGPEVTRAVGEVASNPAVRAELRRRQQEWAAAHRGGVIEGRDIGSVVFPDAVLKLYVTADVEVRARRRAQEVSDLDYDDVVAAIVERDERDRARLDGALVAAPDAVLIDSTGRSVDDVVDQIMKLLT